LVTDNENVKIVYRAHLSSKVSEVDRFTSNQDQNHHRPILHVIEYAEMFRFVIFVSNYPGEEGRNELTA